MRWKSQGRSAVALRPCLWGLWSLTLGRNPRVRKPRDKAKFEVGVQVVERWILARLRNRRFFSLAELNAAIAELLRAGILRMARL